MGNDKLLTFLIITYQRPKKVLRLLQSFLDDTWLEFNITNFEIVIADDHSEDKTYDIIRQTIEALRGKGWSVRYIYREENLRGDRNLYYGYNKESNGKFVWFLCDDDLIDVGGAIKYLKIVFQTKPLISICGFMQGDKNQYGPKFEGDSRFISSFSESVDYLIKFPKTTAYLLRRCPEIELDSLFEKLDFTLFSWIGLSIYLLTIYREEKLFIYPEIVAYADEDYGLLRYSYRVFSNLHFVIKESLFYSKIQYKELKPMLNNLKYEDEIILNITGLISHYSKKSPIRYEEKVLQNEILFFKINCFKIFNSKDRRSIFYKTIIKHFTLSLIPSKPKKNKTKYST